MELRSHFSTLVGKNITQMIPNSNEAFKQLRKSCSVQLPEKRMNIGTFLLGIKLPKSAASRLEDHAGS